MHEQYNQELKKLGIRSPPIHTPMLKKPSAQSSSQSSVWKFHKEDIQPILFQSNCSLLSIDQGVDIVNMDVGDPSCSGCNLSSTIRSDLEDPIQLDESNIEIGEQALDLIGNENNHVMSINNINYSVRSDFDHKTDQAFNSKINYSNVIKTKVKLHSINEISDHDRKLQVINFILKNNV